jgi:hypothetical protein
MDLVSNEIERMAENGTATFANPGDYQAGIGDASVELIVTGGGDFNARLTWLSLRRLHVLRASENLPRIAFSHCRRRWRLFRFLRAQVRH